MKKSLLLFLIPSLLLVGCRGGRGRSSSDPTSNPTSDVTSATSQSGSSVSGSSISSASSASSNTSSATSSSSEEITSSEPLPEVDVISISAANAKGEALKSSVPSGSHEYFSDEIIATKGRVIQAVNIQAYENQLVYICDGEDMIPVLAGGKSAFYKKCQDYINHEDSNFVVYGKIGYSYGHPTIELTNFEFKDSSMPFTIDFSTFSYAEYTSINTYVDELVEFDYNAKGYGVGKLTSLKKMKCIAKADDNSWLFTDGTYCQSVYHQTSNTAFTVGNVYDLYGLSNLTAWRSSIRIFRYVLLEDTVTVDIKSLATEKTCVQMYSVGSPKDDTEKCTATDDFIKTFKFFLKSTVYINRYFQNNNGYYVVAGDNYYSSEISSLQTATTNKMLKFNNNNFNAYTNESRVCVTPWMNENTSLEIYYVEYQFNKYTVSNVVYKIPQVYMFEDLIPAVY